MSPFPISESPSTSGPASSATPRLHRLGALQRAIDAARDAAQPVGLVFVDLDRFHLINARWGRVAGDAILSEIGLRLEQVLPTPQSIVVADGATFAAVLVDVEQGMVSDTATALLGALRQPIGLDGEWVEIGASAGYSYSDNDDAGIDLIEQAYLACRNAKLMARGTALAYADQLHVDAARSRRYEDGLRLAIAADHLVLQFQPTIDLRDGGIAAVEALVRWDHPDEGFLLPDQFLPVAEAAGMMVDLGDWVLEQTVALIGQWTVKYGDRTPLVWVNLAAAQMAAGDHVYDIVQGHLNRGTLRPHQIGFEVTESTVLADLPEASRLLRKLRGLGIEIALDDFGTGYSSLAYLRQLPVTAVKADREFIGGIADSLADEAIVEAVIDLAHALGLRVIAEGVEDQDQHAALIRMSADEAQGFYFAHPCQVAEIERLLEQWPGVIERNSRVAASMPGFGSPCSRLLLTALDTAHGSILVTTADRSTNPTVVYVNGAFEADTGHRARDVIGRPLDALFDDVTADERAWLDSVLIGQQASAHEIRVPRATGKSSVGELALSPIFDDRGIHTHWLGLLRDLSEPRRRARLADFAARVARRALGDDRSELFRSQFEILAPMAELFECSLAYLDLIDLDKNTLTALGDWSPGNDAQPLSRSVYDLDEFPEWLQRLSTMTAPIGSITDEVGTPWADEILGHFGTKAGRNVYVPLRTGSTVLGVLGMNTIRANHHFEEFEVATLQQIASTLTNLLSRGRADEVMRRSAARLSAMMANVSELVVAVDASGRIQWASEGLGRVFHLDQDQVIGADFRDFLLPEDLPELERLFGKIDETDPSGNAVSARLLQPDRAPIWIEIRTAGEFDQELGGYTVTVRDVDALRAKVHQADRIVRFDEIGSGIGEWALNLTDTTQLASGLRDKLALIGEALECSSVSLERFGGSLLTEPVEWRGPIEGGFVDAVNQPLRVQGLQIGQIVAKRPHRRDGWQPDELVLLRRACLSLASLMALRI